LAWDKLPEDYASIYLGVMPAGGRMTQVLGMPVYTKNALNVFLEQKS
jgi:hypothetical protein